MTDDAYKKYEETLGTATYSPEDDKLRFYAFDRLDPETYARVRAAGIQLAPKQELFYAVWNPDREDLITELAGEIGDEDTSLTDRAEERAERFEGYEANRAKDAERAHEAVSSIADGIPLGQPILVGHHSEKHARRDAQKIENGMRRAVKMWETSKYWKSRAAGAIRHAKYLDKPAVRARRIKKLGAALRKAQKEKSKAEFFCKLWQRAVIDENSPELARSQALKISNVDWCGKWGEIDRGETTPEEAAQHAIEVHTRTIASRVRWIAHIENRLIYERAMLDDQGASDLLKPAPRAKHPPLLNYRAESITCANKYRGEGETITYPQVEATRAEYKKVWHDYKGTNVPVNTEPHRIRTVMGNHLRRALGQGLVCVFLTDSKEHPRPEQIDNTEAEKAKAEKIAAELAALDRADELKAEQRAAAEPKQETPTARPVWTPPERTKFDEMKDSLREGVKVVSAPQLFPTPVDLARQMIEAADIEPGQRILEPSAGTGRLIEAVGAARDWQFTLTAVEVNGALVSQLREAFRPENVTVKQADFLSLDGELGKFDRIVMNPPFEKGKDIRHIEHAITMLKPGGRLVALCADGPRQAEKLRPLADSWNTKGEAFKNEGTSVRVVLMTYDAPEPEPASEVTELGEQYTICEPNHPAMNSSEQLTML